MTTLILRRRWLKHWQRRDRKPWPHPCEPTPGSSRSGQPLVALGMVKVLLSPKSLEIQLMKRISEGYDQGIVRDICMPCHHNHRHVIIAYCQDFTALWQGYNDGETLRKHFQTLYNTWIPDKYHVEIANFSFNDEVERMMELLNAATIFYMGGVHGRQRTTRIGAPQLTAMLKRKVQQNEVAYIGICGGGTLAGTPFDLLSGTNVYYESSVSAKMVDVKTNVVEDVVHFTTGCAIAAVLTADSCRAVSFPTVKNKAKWVPFAAKNTLVLQQWLEVKACTSLRCSGDFDATSPLPSSPQRASPHQSLAFEDLGGRQTSAETVEHPIETQPPHQPLAHEYLNQMD